MAIQCTREAELMRALNDGSWPEGAAEELRQHVAGCKGCRAQAELATGLRRMRARAIAEPRLPSAGQVWWRAQIRRRQQEARQLRRPLLGAQIFALVVALAAAAGLLVWLGFQETEPAGWQAAMGNALKLARQLPSGLAAESSLWLLLPVAVALVAVGGAVALWAGEKR